MTRSMAEGAAPPPACTLVIFGATGDLTHRLLMPALYNLGHWGLLPKDFSGHQAMQKIVVQLL